MNNSSVFKTAVGEGLAPTQQHLSFPEMLLSMVSIYLTEFRVEFMLLTHSIRRDDVSELTKKNTWLG